jgi:hypothetical protein
MHQRFVALQRRLRVERDVTFWYHYSGNPEVQYISGLVKSLEEGSQACQTTKKLPCTAGVASVDHRKFARLITLLD